MENVNHAVLEISPYQPGKPIEELERERGIVGAIKLASNENPRGPSAAVREAIRKATDELSRYPDGSAYRLRKLVADRLRRSARTTDVREWLRRSFENRRSSRAVSG